MAIFPTSPTSATQARGGGIGPSRPRQRQQQVQTPSTSGPTAPQAMTRGTRGIIPGQQIPSPAVSSAPTPTPAPFQQQMTTSSGQSMGPRGIIPGQQNTSPRGIAPTQSPVPAPPEPVPAPVQEGPPQPYQDLSQVPLRKSGYRGEQAATPDYMLGGAQEQIRRGYMDALGRHPGQNEIDLQLGNIGWQQGDRYVGHPGLQHILSTLAGSEEGKAFKETGKSALQRQAEAEGRTEAPAPSEEQEAAPQEESRRERRRRRRGIGPSDEVRPPAAAPE